MTETLVFFGWCILIFNQSVHAEGQGKACAYATCATSEAYPDEPQESGYSADYQRACKNPQSAEEADLCQQWRMAQTTDEMAEISADQLDWIKWEIGLLTFTLGLSALAVFAAVQANKLTRKAMIVEQRPWLKIANVFPKSPLSWFADGAHIDVGLVVRNVGKTPARFVLVEADLVYNFLDIDGSDVYRNLVAKARVRGYDEGHTIFPDDDLEEEVELRIPGSRIDIEKQTPILMCCVSYKNPIDDTVHQTGMAVQLRQVSMDGDRFEPIGFGMDVRIEEGRIKFTSQPAGNLVID